MRGDNYSEAYLARTLERQRGRKIKEQMKAPDGLRKQMQANQREMSFDLIQLALGTVFVCYLIATLAGYFFEATFLMFALVGVFFVLRVWRIRSTEVKRTKTSSALKDKRLGINRIWGRIGAERKNK